MAFKEIKSDLSKVTLTKTATDRMNWDNIKKNINRAGTSLLQKTGLVERTVDLEFDTQRERLKDVGSNIEELHKEAKAYLDSVRAVTLTQARLSNELSILSPDPERLARQFRDLNASIGEGGRKRFDEAFRAAVLDPVGRYGILFPECENMIRSRNQKLLDYDAARAKVRKSIDRPSGDAERLPRLESDEQRAMEAYEELNDVLLDGIPRLISSKDSCLKPSMRACIELQTRWAAESLLDIAQIKMPKTSTEYDTEALLQELRQLPILNM